MRSCFDISTNSRHTGPESADELWIEYEFFNKCGYLLYIIFLNTCNFCTTLTCCTDWNDGLIIWWNILLYAKHTWMFKLTYTKGVSYRYKPNIRKKHCNYRALNKIVHIFHQNFKDIIYYSYSASASVRLINPIYFRRQSVTNLIRVSIFRRHHFLVYIQEVMIKTWLKQREREREREREKEREK